MIKDVFNAISNSVESGSMKGANGKGAENVTPGFFGKMLMSLQNQDGETVSPKDQEQADSNLNAEQQTNSEWAGKNKTLHFGVMPEQVSPKPVLPDEDQKGSNLTIGVVKVSEEGEDNESPLETSQENKVEMSKSESEMDSSKMTTNSELNSEEQTSTETKQVETTSEEEAPRSVKNDSKVNIQSEVGEGEKLNSNQINTEGSAKDKSESSSEGNLDITVSGEESEAETVLTDQGNSSLPNTEGLNSESKISQAAQNVSEVQVKEGTVTAKTNTAQTEEQRNLETERSQIQQAQQQTDSEFSLGDDAKDSLKGQLKMQTQQSQEEREKRYDFSRAASESSSISGDRLQPIAGSGASGQQQQNLSFSGQPNWLKFQTSVQQNSSLSEDQQAFLNEQVANATGDVEMDEAEQMGINMSRLSDVPIANATLRRSILPGLTSTVQRAAAEGQETHQMWQKHSFEMEDGNRIELSTRNVDGVIQVKIASSSPELSKLMQQYGQEISEHLEKECEIEVDLQFKGGNENEMSEFFGGADSRENGREGSQYSSGSDQKAEQKSKEHLQHAVRKFGYNQMEWTA